MTQKQLETLLKDLQALPKECEWAEFKVDNSNPQEIGEYLSALSNGACYSQQPSGYLVFGIEDVTHRLVGTEFRPRTEKKGNQELENWLATQLEPRIDFRVHEFSYAGLDFVIFVVDATRDTPVSFRGQSFIRVGSYKKPLADHPERQRKIWNQTNHFVFEKQVAAEHLTAEQVLDLLDCPGYFKLTNRPIPTDQAGIMSRLVTDRLVRKEHGEFTITNLGAILFAKDLDTFEDLARKAVRVIVYQGNNRVKTKREQLGRKGYAIGFAGLIQFIADQITTEVIDRDLRRKVTVYPILAIRELVANVITHQDFSIRGTSPMIELFDNRMEITNPGAPLIDPLRFVDHNAISRNEQMARFMRLLNLCEERGSGIDKVVYECELHQLPAPEIVAGDDYTRVILYGPRSLREMDKQDQIRACYLHACLKRVSGEIMTNQTLRERLGVEEQNYSLISRIIGDAKAAGLVKDYDPDSRSRKYASYVPFWA